MKALAVALFLVELSSAASTTLCYEQEWTNGGQSINDDSASGIKTCDGTTIAVYTGYPYAPYYCGDPPVNDDGGYEYPSEYAVHTFYEFVSCIADACDNYAVPDHYDSSTDLEWTGLGYYDVECSRPTSAPSATPSPTVTPVPTVPCPYNLTASGKCLFLSDEPVTFQECETDVCGPAGAALVCISSESENDEVLDLMNDYEDDGYWLHSAAWIGYNDGVSGEGAWGWNSGCGSTYDNWASGEPDDYCDEDCAMIYSSGEWNDQSCRESLRCVCEYGATATEAFDEWNANAEAIYHDCNWNWSDDAEPLDNHAIVGLLVIGIAIGVGVCYCQKCCCFQNRQNQAGQPATAQPQFAQPGVVVVGQPQYAQRGVVVGSVVATGPQLTPNQMEQIEMMQMQGGVVQGVVVQGGVVQGGVVQGASC